MVSETVPTKSSYLLLLLLLLLQCLVLMFQSFSKASLQFLCIKSVTHMVTHSVPEDTFIRAWCMVMLGRSPSPGVDDLERKQRHHKSLLMKGDFFANCLCREAESSVTTATQQCKLRQPQMRSWALYRPHSIITYQELLSSSSTFQQLLLSSRLSQCSEEHWELLPSCKGSTQVPCIWQTLTAHNT